MATNPSPAVNGRILVVDLDKQKTRVREAPSGLYKTVIGGKGLGAWFLLEYIDPKVNPLSPKNPIMFLTGPLTGLPFFSKTVLVTKSPLTNCFLDCYSGGFVGSNLKHAGYDGLIVTGKAETPLWIEIFDETVIFHDANELWGLTTDQTEKRVRKDLGLSRDRAAVATIGPAGENKVLYACIQNHGRSFGRGGSGAVFGSKNLKAITVSGTGSIQIANPKRFLELREQFASSIVDDPRAGGLRPYGTLLGTGINNEKGALPSFNAQDGQFPDVEKISAETMKSNGWFVKNTACEGCSLACGKVIHGKTGRYAGIINEGPEYETSFAFGSSCGISDGSVIIKADQLCDNLGMDTISAGTTIAFAIECAEKGLIGSELDQGTLSWGDGEGVIRALELIARREKIGDLLAEGSMRMARKIGHGSEAFAQHSKGMETSGWDPRSLKGMGLEFATSDRGGDHNRGGTQPIDIPGEKVTAAKAKQKAAFLVENQNFVAAIGCLVTCRFTAFAERGTPSFYADLLNAATGYKLNAADLLKVGERAYNLSSYFNYLAGYDRSSDTLSERIHTLPLKSGAPSGSTLSKTEFKMMLDNYYKERKWSQQTGRPTLDNLKALDIELPDRVRRQN
ncbi:MAG: aldehyde ferredoxin oxidoreductase family protein [Candidatus Ranarchaeia archaeon]